MDKLSCLIYFRAFIKCFGFLLVSFTCFENAFPKQKVTTLLSSKDPFYRITLYRENYILPYHCLRQVVLPEPISIDWIQPIMDPRIEKRGKLDSEKGKATLLTKRRVFRGKTVRMPARQRTINTSHRKTPLRKRSARRNGMILEPEQIPPIPPTPEQKTPISPILRKQRSFQNSYFDNSFVRSPQTYSRPFNSVQNTPIEPELSTLPEEKVMTEVPRVPMSAASYKQSPLEDRLRAIKAHMDAYARLAGNPKKTNEIQKKEKIQKVINKLVHVIAERPYYDYMVEEEVAFQISLKIPLFYIENTDTRFYAAYTQRSWWQTKTSISAFFRETNFMPEFFVEQPFLAKPGWLLQIESLRVGGIHQSNGEGLEWERSWNRLFFEIYLKSGPFRLVFEPWWVLSTKDKAIYNPDIEEYLGWWRINLSFKHKLFECSFQKQKNAYQVLGNIPFSPSLNLTFFYFNGKGSTLSLYKEHNSSWGIGIGTKV